MRTLYKILRALIVTLFICAVAIPAAVYLLLSSSWVQEQLGVLASRELSKLLGTEVTVGSLNFHLSGRLSINDISIADDYGKTALSIHSIDTRAEMFDFITRQKTIIDYAIVDDARVFLYRDSVGAPLNIAGIIARLSGKEEKPSAVFDLRINNVSLTGGSFAYDILNSEHTPGRFDPAHILVEDIRTEVFVPRVANDCCRLWLRSFSAVEQSGLRITNLTVDTDITGKLFKTGSLVLELPSSRLAFQPFSIDIDGIDDISRIGTKIPVEISVLPGSHVFLPDLAPVVPVMADCAIIADVDLCIDGILSDMNIRRLRVTDHQNRAEADISGTVTGLPDIKTAHTDGLTLEVRTTATTIPEMLPRLGSKSADDKIETIISALGNTEIEAELRGGMEGGSIIAKLISESGDINARCEYSQKPHGWYTLTAEASIDSLDVDSFVPGKDLGLLDADISLDGVMRRHVFDGDISARIATFAYRGYTYHGINANVRLDSGGEVLDLVSTDPNAQINAYMVHTKDADKTHLIDGVVKLEKCRLDTLHLSDLLPGGSLASVINVHYDGRDLDDCALDVKIDGTRYITDLGQGLKVRRLHIDFDNTSDFGHLIVVSDFINGSAEGKIKPTAIKDAVMGILEDAIPVMHAEFQPVGDTAEEPSNIFSFDFSICDAETICSFFRLPVYVVGEGSVSGFLREDIGGMAVTVDMPWLQKGTKLIENTLAQLTVNGKSKHISAYASTYMPTGKGPMSLTAVTGGDDGLLHTTIDWNINRQQPIGGKLNFNTQLRMMEGDAIGANVDIEPGVIDFGEDIWHIEPSRIRYAGGDISIDNFKILADKQSLLINGQIGRNADDRLDLSIDNFNLINIFETLEIDKVMLGGRATGDIHATALLSPTRMIDCKSLRVKDISYNFTILGDAEIQAWFDNDKEAICFSADVRDDNRLSHIGGAIAPATEGLDLEFTADKINVAFLQPFMSGFCSEVSGRASGQAHLYGTFSDVDLEGDLYTDSLGIKIDVVNVWYHASDSVHIRPGRINFDGIRIYDDYGHSATLQGYLGHRYFHDAFFDISAVNARDLMCFDVSKKLSPTWYGHIFADGKVNILGKPGHVDITANVTTAPNSVFTFELSDLESASEYSFLTFRDVTPIDFTKTNVSDTPERVTYLRHLAQKKEDEELTTYTMDLAVDVSRTAKIVLVMDPVSGDQIDANGDGHVRVIYDSQDDEMRLYGNYTLSQGTYNFTLQDIIIKNFTIKPGSTIAFNGNPEGGILNIEAYHAVNANLSDLDESFLTDKELNRTNVPVRALMKITGDMRQPDLDFDLEFPTLNQDIYRKVRSIISTEEMMNKQIIYLLALGRFFTPEYMAATRGNELFSVASSTITSQLSSILGKLSDNWSIAPNLRSDKGDFSDVEVDVNLSSSLLNNRLLFNGNFGYRDKSLNTNQFVGDFDIEYLLSRSGTWRLKAYNRYNDQNYYLRTAQTTQGIGIIYRKDFDNILGFLHKRKKETPNHILIEDNISIDDTSEGVESESAITVE